MPGQEHPLTRALVAESVMPEGPPALVFVTDHRLVRS